MKNPVQNTSIAFVGADGKFTVLEEDATLPYLGRIADVPRARQPGVARADDAPQPLPSQEDESGEQQVLMHRFLTMRNCSFLSAAKYRRSTAGERFVIEQRQQTYAVIVHLSTRLTVTKYPL